MIESDRADPIYLDFCRFLTFNSISETPSTLLFLFVRSSRRRASYIDTMPKVSRFPSPSSLLLLDDDDDADDKRPEARRGGRRKERRVFGEAYRPAIWNTADQFLQRLRTVDADTLRPLSFDLKRALPLTTDWCTPRKIDATRRSRRRNLCCSSEKDRVCAYPLVDPCVNLPRGSGNRDFRECFVRRLGDSSW